MKVGDFKGEVGQRVFFLKRIVFSGFDAVSKCAHTWRIGKNPIFIECLENLMY